MEDEVQSRLPKWLAWRPWKNGTTAPEDELDKRYHNPGPVRRLLRLILPGHVSRIHLYEAQERYLTLCRMLEYHGGQSPEAPQDEGRQTAIKMCRSILQEASCLLTRRQNDLNFLWREMTRVHIMLAERVLPDNLLPVQLDLCREDARRLAASKEPEVDDMLQRLAEVTQENDIAKNKDRMIRVIRALIERFTTIRTGRIHHQFVNIRIYQLSLVILIPILVLLIANRDLVTAKLESQELALSKQVREPIEKPIWFDLTCRNVTTELPCLLYLPVAWLKALYDGTRYLLGTNILAFIFFAGLAGGFFSVVIRLRNRELIPGEDAYFVWYVLSKPFIGALGAVVLFILLNGDFISVNILDPVVDQLKQHEFGPITFGFGFLAGFSERIVFPEFR